MGGDVVQWMGRGGGSIFERSTYVFVRHDPRAGEDALALSMNNGGSAGGPPTPSVEEDQISQGGWHFFRGTFCARDQVRRKNGSVKKEGGYTIQPR